MAGSETFDRARIIELLGKVNEELARDDARAEIYVVGRAAMLLAYDGRTATRDVDCAMREGRTALQAAARRVAKAEDLGEYWLNDAVTWQYLPDSPDRNEERVLEYSHLTVSVASRERMLAMRLDAGRPSSSTTSRGWPSSLS